MSVVQGFGDCCHQFRRLVKTGASFPDFRRQVATPDVLGHDEAKTVVGASHVVDRHNMRMIETRKDAGFVQVCLDIFGARNPLRVRHLDRNRTLEVIVVCQVDPSETALTQGSDDWVTPDLLWKFLRCIFSRAGCVVLANRPVVMVWVVHCHSRPLVTKLSEWAQVRPKQSSVISSL